MIPEPLSAAQVEFFLTFGFLVLRELFDEAELETMRSEYADGLARVEPLFAAPIGVRGQMSWSSMHDQAPFLTNSLEHPRLLTVADQLLDGRAVGVMSNSNRFTGRMTEWHSDTSAKNFRSVKLLAYFQPLTASTGALRVIPGSHLAPLHDRLVPTIGTRSDNGSAGNPESDAVASLDLAVDEVPAYVCETQPGDVIAFDLRTWHSSFGGSAERSMCSFTYFADPGNAPEQEAIAEVARQLHGESLFRELRRQREWRRRRPEVPVAAIPRSSPQYTAQWLDKDHAGTRRAHWVDRLTEWGFVTSTDGAA